MTGDDPGLYIDHKNRIKDQNWWDNLRLATHGQNYINSTYFGEMRGIYHRGGEKYRVRISHASKRYNVQVLGLENAKELHRKLELEHYGEFACDRR